MDQNIPQRWRIVSFICFFIVFFIAIIFIVRGCEVKEYKAEKFHKEKEARRGKIRKAREGREKVAFTQQRFGVVRSCFLEDPSGLRRQFFLEAKSAEISTSYIEKKSTVKEVFFQPKGWLQEELFYEVSSTGEKVVQKNDMWVSASPPHRPISNHLYREVSPMQQLRFFDAVTAEWVLDTNELVAKDAFFSIIKAPGHELPNDLNIGKTLSKGTARAITFAFDKKGRQIVKSEGVKLHLSPGKV